MSTTKRYVNQSTKMRIITFTDGSASFLFRGQSIETDKEVKTMDEGIKIKDAKKPTRTKKSGASETTENE